MQNIITLEYCVECDVHAMHHKHIMKRRLPLIAKVLRPMVLGIIAISSLMAGCTPTQTTDYTIMTGVLMVGMSIVTMAAYIAQGMHTQPLPPCPDSHVRCMWCGCMYPRRAVGSTPAFCSYTCEAEDRKEMMAEQAREAAMNE